MQRTFSKQWSRQRELLSRPKQRASKPTWKTQTQTQTRVALVKAKAKQAKRAKTPQPTFFLTRWSGAKADVQGMQRLLAKAGVECRVRPSVYSGELVLAVSKADVKKATRIMRKAASKLPEWVVEAYEARYPIREW